MKRRTKWILRVVLMGCLVFAITIVVYYGSFAVWLIHVPTDPLSPSIESSELRSHTEFLASAALAGRKPNTKGSAIARKYLRKRFNAIGLVPWGKKIFYRVAKK